MGACVVAGHPKSRDRMRKKVARKIRHGELLTPYEVQFLRDEGNKKLQLNPYDKEAAAAALARKQELAQIRKDAHTKAYKQFAEQTLGKVAQVQLLALDKALEQAKVVDPATGETVIDPSLVKNSDLKIALAVAKELAERTSGKATQKIEGKMSVGLFQQLADEGEL